jgi:hypothetical protein
MPWSVYSLSPSASAHDRDSIAEQRNDGRGSQSNRYSIETSETGGNLHRKGDGNEQRACDVWGDLADDKGVPMQILKPEILSEGTNDHEQEDANGDKPSVPMVGPWL